MALRLGGVKAKKSLEVKGWMVYFLVLFPEASEPSMNFYFAKINNNNNNNNNDINNNI